MGCFKKNCRPEVCNNPTEFSEQILCYLVVDLFIQCEYVNMQTGKIKQAKNENYFSVFLWTASSDRFILNDTVTFC